MAVHAKLFYWSEIGLIGGQTKCCAGEGLIGKLFNLVLSPIIHLLLLLINPFVSLRKKHQMRGFSDHMALSMQLPIDLETNQALSPTFELHPMSDCHK